jgi:uncharacterized RmlC-like cupin family protein
MLGASTKAPEFTPTCSVTLHASRATLHTNRRLVTKLIIVRREEHEVKSKDYENVSCVTEHEHITQKRMNATGTCTKSFKCEPSERAFAHMHGQQPSRPLFEAQKRHLQYSTKKSR